jgi:solute carrier family 25 carnitine/acylcarnitine transporter 20/29
MQTNNVDFCSYIYGGISGAIGVSGSHPFDTIKTCIQTNKKIEYTPKFLYRGMSAPLVGLFVEKMTVFGTYENVFRMLNESINSVSMKHIISGSSAGFVATFVVTPIERIKIIKQTNQKLTKDLFHPKKLYKGLTATWTREVPGFGIYFWTFGTIKEKVYNGKMPVLGSLWAGGISGALAWLFIYPQDVIKSRIQVELNNNQSMFQIAKNIKNEGGLRIFYKGFHLALMRAIPLHSLTLTANELLKRHDPFNSFGFTKTK